LLYASFARLFVLLFVLNQIGPAIWIHSPQLREHLSFAAGTDPVEPYQIQVIGNGDLVEFRGGLRYGSADTLQSVLADVPGAQVLKIDSPGGRVAEGLKMMALVRQRGMDTYASQRCISAATLVLSAGKSRGAETGTKIGFHACRNPSGNSETGDALVMGGLVSAGVAEDFVRRVLSVPSDSMWFPLPDEMLRAGVLTSYGVFPPNQRGTTNAPRGIP
jgi:hypothetical protein